MMAARIACDERRDNRGCSEVETAEETLLGGKRNQVLGLSSQVLPPFS
jgi:hypothetical protein